MISITQQFPDFGLRLGVLDTMLVEGVLKESDLEPAILKGIDALRTKSEFWIDGALDMEVSSPEEVLEIVTTNFGDIQISQTQIDAVTYLQFDGGNDIYMHLEEHTATLLGLEDWELDTGGESDLYLVNGFEGIEILKNLKELDLGAYGSSEEIRDVAPLGKIPALKQITSIYGGAEMYTHMDAISHLIK